MTGTTGKRSATAPLPVAEFFAGIGLMRAGLEASNRFRVIWANDIAPAKQRLYSAAHGDAGDFALGDIRCVQAAHIPDVALATASFPCTDLSLAGGRRGLAGEESGTFWEFHRILGELEAQSRLPSAILLENVVGFASSRDGADLTAVLESLNQLGYICDILVLDAARFVPQSRPRMFIVGAVSPTGAETDWEPSELRPAWIQAFLATRPHLKVRAQTLPAPPERISTLADVVERFPEDSPMWWSSTRLKAFVSSLSDLQSARLRQLVDDDSLAWRTAYRRTRNGKATWEVRADEIAGCLRTARGGSSKQAVVEAGKGNVRVRWMSPREYARLQGAPDYPVDGFRPSEVHFGFGDAVCVPAIAWLAQHYLSDVTTPASAG